MFSKLLKPGTLVACRPDFAGNLILWASPFSDIDEDVAIVGSDDVLLIIKRKSTTKKNDKKVTLTPEWEIGSYMVLTSSGARGWVGAGWVVPISDL